MRKYEIGDKVWVIGAVRTPIGAIAGSLKDLTARELAAFAIKGLLKQTGIDPSLVQYTSLGWVMQDMRFPNIAKIASEDAGIPNTVPGTTIHENCASGAAAIHDVVRRIMVGDIDIGVAGGTESMSQVPRLLFAGRIKNQLYGDMILVDGIMGALFDSNVGEKGELMGLLTERLVAKYNVTRQEQDEIAYRSHHNALKAWDEGYFSDYVIPIPVPQKKGDPIIVSRDEGPKPVTMEVLSKQKPYFKPDGGTITAMNASSINDAAAAVLLMSPKKAKELGFKPLAAVYAYHNIGVPAEYMGEGAFKVIRPLLKKAGMSIEEIDYFEINEAFAAVLGAAFHDIPELKVEKVNQWGSGISLGHPVGCTGARQFTDMVHQLIKRNARVGLTSRCVGGGIGSGEIIIRAD